MTDERQSRIQEIIEAHRNILRTLAISTSSAWIELDLSMAQLKTLWIIHAAGVASIGEIAETLGVGQPTASHLVDRLVQAQLVARAEDPLDRRRTLAQLSVSGKELIERLQRIRNEPLRRWLAQLDEAALEALRQGLRALDQVASEAIQPADLS
jgi:DNA-binding MarR family transcriptional regulator